MEEYWWIFVVVGALLLLTAIYFIVKKINNKNAVEATHGIDSVVGMKCTVVDTIDASAGCGMVKVGAHAWAARAVDEEAVYEVGQVLRVVAIEGAKLICKK